MVWLMVLLCCLAAGAAAQEIPLGDAARANRASKAKPAPADAKPGADTSKRRTFTNDDVQTPAPTPTASSAAAPAAKRHQRANLTLQQRNSLSGRIAYVQALIRAIDRDAKPLREKQNKSQREIDDLAARERRLAELKVELAKYEAQLYE